MGGGDCILIPGAEDAMMAPKPDKVCGTKAGLPTAADMAEKTVCCKLFLLCLVGIYSRGQNSTNGY